MAILSDSPQFGSVLDRRTSEKRIWWFVVPGVLVLGALIAATGISVAKVSGLETQVRLAQQQAADAQRTVEDRDKLLQKARVDEDVLRSAGQGAAVLAASDEESPASGVAIYHPERHALKVYAFGLRAPPQGQEYRLDAVKESGERTSIAALSPDERGAAFTLAREVPEGSSRIAIRLAPRQAKEGAEAKAGEQQQPATQEVTPAGKEPEGTVLLSGALPKPGEAGVVAAPQVQARSPAPAPRRRR